MDVSWKDYLHETQNNTTHGEATTTHRQYKDKVNAVVFPPTKVNVDRFATTVTDDSFVMMVNDDSFVFVLATIICLVALNVADHGGGSVYGRSGYW